MTLRIERTDAPTDEERQAILAPLRAYNTAKTGGTTPELVAWLVRDEHDAIVGGLYGRVFFRWLYIELLVVPEQARGQGTGSTLMQMAETLAREKNCVGFTPIGQIDDYPPGHQHFFFQKRLAD